ncbi:Cys-tRNA(Pro) deacylase [Nocardiopsis algeriensis]|uniref:Cys-tRNA(Pro)/Cys-tRNA(Cys) deacylase n=1 Tax=Nocardiopsis algeriensis TaxID=1478215 RepID=A0A841IRV4_9ACTN|nr:Cys-tRNA(Pro) deacylase [Nocardiopsis algeriensis]MBB6121413.1 Cys-tRNA(Pro)/Cys-tRNA(Cys) deacylase [Nocardiopsis algeriensis]
MSGKATPATVAAGRTKTTYTLHPYEAGGDGHSYGTDAADALGVPREQVFKTLIAEVDGAFTVGVVPVSTTLDLKALAAAVGGKRAVLADPVRAERITGYVRGGISPLGQRKRLRTVIDSSVTELPAVYVSAGRRGLQMQLAPTDLVRLTEAITAPIGAP